MGRVGGLKVYLCLLLFVSVNAQPRDRCQGECKKIDSTVMSFCTHVGYCACIEAGSTPEEMDTQVQKAYQTSPTNQQTIQINDCHLHFKNVSCAGTFQLCEWYFHQEVKEWQSQPLLPCYDMCKSYVIACTNDPLEVDKKCNDSLKFKRDGPCTGFPYTVEASCDKGTALGAGGLLLNIVLGLITLALTFN